MSNNKIYVIDTNVFLYDPQAIFSFNDAIIGIPINVLEELDHFKEEKNNRGRNAREIIRILDQLRQKGSLAEGVSLENGSIVKAVFPSDDHTCPAVIEKDVGDNRILFTAYCMKLDGYIVRFVSKDLNARVKSDILGIQARDYFNKDFVSEDQFYKGWKSVDVPAVELKKGFPVKLLELSKQKELFLNEYILVRANSNPFNYRVFRFLGGKNFKEVVAPKLSWPFYPKNAQQIMALDALLDDSIQLVTLFGPAGTGKTFLTLLASLEKVLVEDIYGKILISRPIVPLGHDIGYLPGDIAEKLNFQDPLYFSRKFRKEYGITASEYRNTYQIRFKPE